MKTLKPSPQYKPMQFKTLIILTIHEFNLEF